MRKSPNTLLAGVTLLSALAGYLAGRGGSPTATERKPERVASFSIPSHGAAGGSAVSAQERLDPSDWLARAVEISGAAGLGFDPGLDAPGLLLALEKLKPEEIREALRLLGERGDFPGRKRLEEWLLAEWARKHPLDAMTWTEEHGGGRRAETLAALARVYPAAAWKKLKANPSFQLPSGEINDVYSPLFVAWAKLDRAAALRALGEISQNKSLTGNESVVAVHGFWKGALPDRTENPDEWKAASDGLAAEILRLDGERERLFLLSSLLSHYREGFGSDRGNSEASTANREKAGDWLDSLSLDERTRAAMFQSLAQRDGCSADEAPRAYPWLWEKVPESRRADTFGFIVDHWAAEEPWSARDPDACGEWINTLGRLGPEYSAGMQKFAEYAAARDPEAGLAWAENIADPVLRNQASASVAALIRSRWPDRADSLLETAGGENTTGTPAAK